MNFQRGSLRLGSDFCFVLGSSQQSCANESSAWAPLPANSTEVTMDSHFDEEDNLESQVIFGHLESTVAVRCLARNEMAAVSREIKLVSNGKITNTQTQSHTLLRPLSL